MSIAVKSNGTATVANSGSITINLDGTDAAMETALEFMRKISKIYEIQSFGSMSVNSLIIFLGHQQPSHTELIAWLNNESKKHKGITSITA